MCSSAMHGHGAQPGGGQWEHFEHVADIGVHGIGATRAEAFKQAAIALTAVVTDPASVQPRTRIEITCTASDEELLLVEWLNALVFEMATRRMLFRDFDVRTENGRLTASAVGEEVDRERHQPAVEVKGATCTGLSVKQQEDGLWHARCVVDV